MKLLDAFFLPQRRRDAKYFLRLYAFAVILFSSCNSKKQADFIVHNAVVYTVDSSFSVKQSFAVKDGKILATGSDEEIFAKYEAKEKVNLEGKAVYPGFIDAHCHFLYYGLGISEVNLTGTKSFNEVLARTVRDGQCHQVLWVQGRGWDQNDWEDKTFPNNDSLDQLFPKTAVLLKRIDGHAALANSEALKRAGITADTKVEGGKIEVKNGKLTGILIDNAMELAEKAIPPPSHVQLVNALQIAEKNCFAVGLTTVDEAGLEKNQVLLIDSLQKAGVISMRIYAMLTPGEENEKQFYGKKNGRYKTDQLNVRSVKVYADGALGSRGACLFSPYSDKPDQQGFLLHTTEYFTTIAKKCSESGFQVNTHCIGDSAVHLMLDIYSRYFDNHCLSVQKSEKRSAENTLRWRIEHFQVTTPRDLQQMNCINLPTSLPNAPQIIPSVQPTHAASDMYWAKDRLGEKRMKYAYAYKDLLKVSGMLALGTDFPVENINPLFTFYSAVARKDLKGFPDAGFQPENALSREETLRGMTIWAAYSNFEENEKGSLEPGKFADFIVLDTDIMKTEEPNIPKTKVLKTFVNGEQVYPEK